MEGTTRKELEGSFRPPHSFLIEEVPDKESRTSPPIRWRRCG